MQPHLSDPTAWEFRGKRVHRLPWEWVMAGVLGEGSSHRDHVYVWALAMPLFVPSDHVTLDFSQRVRPSGRFGLDEPELLAEAIRSALAGVESEATYLQRWATQNPADEAGAYALVLLGRESEAAAALADARDRLVEDGRTWALHNAERIATVESVLREGGLAGTQALLAGWRDQTARSVKLLEGPG